MKRLFAIGVLLGTIATPLLARDSVGMFGDWGAFRDPSVPRCYAIAKPEPTTRRADYKPFATIGIWPRQNVRNQFHVRLSRQLAQGARVTLTIGGQSYLLTGGGGDAWARDPAMDAAIVAAMRSATRMNVRGLDSRGNRFTDRYSLEGAATAMDAATIACAQRRSR